MQVISPAFSGSVQCDNPHAICDFNLSWSETAGQLDAVSITVDYFHDSIGFPLIGGPFPFGLTGGSIGSNNTLGGCTNARCTVTGFWQSDLPEPTSAALLVCAVFGFALVRGYRRERAAPAR